MQKQKYRRLSIGEKVEIIRYMDNNTMLCDNKIAQIFSTKFNRQISRKSVNYIKNNKQSILESFSGENRIHIELRF